MTMESIRHILMSVAGRTKTTAAMAMDVLTQYEECGMLAKTY